MAEVLHRLGSERAFVVGGQGIDELPLDGTGTIHDVTPGGVTSRPVNATALGLTKASTTKLAGGSPEDNARIVEAILRGEPGARRDVVLLNAGAAFVVAGVVDDLAGGIEQAGLTIDAGLGTELLERLRAERRAADAAAAAAAPAEPAAEGTPA
jgi:anthranilate phosphoribosyltransferase